MPFNEARYVQDFIKKLRGAHSLPDDLMARYAITLPATDSEITAQVKAVRAYWNKTYQGQSTAAQVARMCRAEDERLRAEHGPKMETRSWWENRQSERRSAAEASITVLADEFRQAYGPLGVVTTGIIDRFAAKLGLTAADAKQAVEQARLTLVEGVELPESEPIAAFPALITNMSECAVNSIPELIHPGSGPFKLLDRYVCLKDPAKRLDAVAVDTQSAEADKRGISATEDAHRGALKILRRALKDGVDLRDVALFHLILRVRDFAQLSASMAAAELQKLGLDRQDAAVIAVMLADQSAARGAAGLSKVQDLLAAGRLREAEQTALLLPADSNSRAEAAKEVGGARERLTALLAEIRRVLNIPDETRANDLLREVARISAEDADEVLATVPLAPPTAARAACEGVAVKLFWERGSGHSDGTTYVVTRTRQRAPAAVSDGSVVHRGRETSCTDDHAPVAYEVQYGVFAIADGRYDSRPAILAVTLLPPVSQLEADVGPAEVTIRWSAHPDAQEVRVMRSAPGIASVPVAVTGSSCHLAGLPEGERQHFEVTAIYQGTDGAEIPSPVEQISATPRSQAQPIPKLRARPVPAAGTVQLRVSWKPVDRSEIRIMRSAVPSRWPFGAWVSQEDMRQAGQELTGRRIQGQAEVAIQADVPPGVHYLTPFSIGGTGIVVGRTAAVGITELVRHLAVTPFATYAMVSWEWPPATQLAEVSWDFDGEADSSIIGLAQYRTQGGARVPLGRGPCTVEVRAVIVADGVNFTSPPVTEVVGNAADVTIRYSVSSTPTLGPFGGRSKTVVFTSDEGCAAVQVRMVATPGRVMPGSAESGFTLLDTTLNLRPGVPDEYLITVPRAVKRPYWVRCFVTGGQAGLIDPPISCLKET